MKKIIFCATVAFSCCGMTSLYGQIHLPHGTPMPAPLLVSGQDLLDAEIDDESPMPFATPSPAIANPFDLGPPTAPAETNTQLVEPTAQVDSATTQDPTSLPVGRRHRGRTIVDTMIDYNTLSNTPHAAYAPVQWSPVAQTPNPVAQFMLRQECVDGLWAGYSAQRAAECAAMWAHLSGHHGHCCGLTAGSPCDVCADLGPRNRYRRQHHRRHHGAAKASSCDASCDQCAANASAADATVPATAEATPKQPETKLASVPNYR